VAGAVLWPSELLGIPPDPDLVARNEWGMMGSVRARRLAIDLVGSLLGLVLAWAVVSQVWISFDGTGPMWGAMAATIGAGAVVARRHRTLLGLGIGLAVSALLNGAVFTVLSSGPRIS
jgi:hypothetical protein